MFPRSAISENRHPGQAGPLFGDSFDAQDPPREIWAAQQVGGDKREFSLAGGGFLGGGFHLGGHDFWASLA